MDYETVFDVLDAGYRYWWFPAGGAVFVALGLALPRLIRAGVFRRSPPFMEKWFPRVFLSFSIIWTTIALVLSLADYLGSVAAMKNGRTQFVEGKVTDFVPMPYGGHAEESFSVQSQRFSYSDFGLTSGFNSTSSHGGPIREGLEVRIWHLRGKILKLQIRRQPNQALQTTPMARSEI